MGSERMPEPWSSFLSEVDHAATSEISMHCLGGFAVSLYHGLACPTGDIDVVEVSPEDAKPWLARTAGRDSALHRKYKVYLQIVNAAEATHIRETLHSARSALTGSMRLPWRAGT